MPLDADLAEALRRSDLPPAFERFRAVLAPGDSRPTRPADWAGCLVLVERGTVEVVCDPGTMRSFGAGDLLALGWLPVRALRNLGAGEACLLAVRRRGKPSDEARQRPGPAAVAPNPVAGWQD